MLNEENLEHKHKKTKLLICTIAVIFDIFVGMFLFGMCVSLSELGHKVVFI